MDITLQQALLQQTSRHFVLPSHVSPHQVDSVAVAVAEVVAVAVADLVVVADLVFASPVQSQKFQEAQ